MAIRGEISLPGDKSISHRALMFAAIADGESRISNLSTGRDVQTTMSCLKSCGIKFRNDGDSLIVIGGEFTDPEKPLDCGNSGTTARLLLGLLHMKGINATLIGDDSLSSRPMNRILDPLSQMGLESKSNHGKLPITIYKSNLNNIHYNSSVASAQVKSAVLLAGLGSQNETSITEPILSRDHTERMLMSMGANIICNKLQTIISKTNRTLSPIQLTVPGDPSTAAFFSAAAAIIPNSDLTLNRILKNPTRIGFNTALQRMGANISYIKEWTDSGEILSNIRVVFQRLKGISISKKDVPGIIDELPILAILATQALGKTEVRGAEELRVKECDRIHALCSNLKKMGSKIKELKDGFIIHGPTQLKGAKIKTFQDHRITMAFTIAEIVSDGKLILDYPGCASVSYPEFYDELARLNK